MASSAFPRVVAGAVAAVLTVGIGSGAAAVPAPQRPQGTAVSTAAHTGAARQSLTDLQVDAYIGAVYADLFDRAPDPVGLAGWGDALRTGTPLRAVADSITSSDEFRAGLIADAYRSFLGREPDPAGAAYWLQRMRAGLTIQGLAAGFLGSDEYYAAAAARFPQSDRDVTFIQTLYRDVLGRLPGQEELFAWLRPLIGRWIFVSGGRPLDFHPDQPPARMSREQIAFQFLISTERLSADLDGEYEVLLGRPLDPSGRATWVTAIQHGVRYESVIGSIIASPEYVSSLG